MELKVKDLNIGHSDVELFKVSGELVLEKGQIYPIVGDNGSGKSTFLKVLAGLNSPLSGEIFYNKENISDIDLFSLAQYRSILLTQRPQFSWISVYEILDWTSATTLFIDQNKDDLIQQVAVHMNIKDLLSREFISLSDGQKQRVMLARVLCQQSPILMLDEPTTFLDVKGKKEILEKIESWAYEWEKTVLLCTHEWSWLVQKNIECLFVNTDKKILEPLRPIELIERGHYPDLNF